MRFGHGITKVINSDNPYDGAAEGISSTLLYSDFGNKGNHLAKNISSGLHYAQNQAEIDNKINDNINKNIEKARNIYKERMQYEAKQTAQSETSPYDSKMAERIKLRSMQEIDAPKTTAPLEETLSEENIFSNSETSSELSLPVQTDTHSNNDKEKITALRTKPATEPKAQILNTPNNPPIAERIAYTR